jgi:hypothetical protein
MIEILTFDLDSWLQPPDAIYWFSESSHRPLAYPRRQLAYLLITGYVVLHVQ